MGFSFEKLQLDGLVLINPLVHLDERGHVKVAYSKSAFFNAGLNQEFVQENYSLSNIGVLRGLHYQLGSYAQGKLVSVVKGKVWDVVVDIRKESCTFGKWTVTELSSENHQMLWIPPGFAHGFVALEDETIFQYKCTQEYNKESERAIRWNDPYLNIPWPIKSVKLSQRDADSPFFNQAELFQ